MPPHPKCAMFESAPILPHALIAEWSRQPRMLEPRNLIADRSHRLRRPSGRNQWEQDSAAPVACFGKAKQKAAKHPSTRASQIRLHVGVHTSNLTRLENNLMVLSREGVRMTRQKKLWFPSFAGSLSFPTYRSSKASICLTPRKEMRKLWPVVKSIPLTKNYTSIDPR